MGLRVYCSAKRVLIFVPSDLTLFGTNLLRPPLLHGASTAYPKRLTARIVTLTVDIRVMFMRVEAIISACLAGGGDTR